MWTVDPYNDAGPFRIFREGDEYCAAMCERREDADLIAAALNADSPQPEPTVEIDGVVMPQSHYDAARWPLLNGITPDLGDAMSVEFGEAACPLPSCPTFKPVDAVVGSPTTDEPPADAPQTSDDELEAVKRDRARLIAKLALPCGSCHPCTNWSDETWRRADRKPPSVHRYDETVAEVRSLRGVVQAVREWAYTNHGGIKTPAEVWPGLAALLAEPALAAAADAPQPAPVTATDVPPLPNDLEPQPEWCIVHFAGGPWDGQQYQAERVVGPLFAVGHEIGNHYLLDTKSDPPTYHWDGTPWSPAGPSPAVLPDRKASE